MLFRRCCFVVDVINKKNHRGYKYRAPAEKNSLDYYAIQHTYTSANRILNRLSLYLGLQTTYIIPHIYPTIYTSLLYY